MKQLTSIMLTALALLGHQLSNAQCNGVKGPNLLGAKGTFSAPAITVNAAAAACTSSGSASYNPTGNIGNALTGCTATIGSAIPCSDYTYTSANGGLGPEARYSILKTIGNANGGNCIKGDWRGSDHTGDGGYFMAVNGAPNTTTSPVFYQIKSIPVCIGATYNFSAWVINLLPGSPTNTAGRPNISFTVNGTVIANSGPIAYATTPTWVQVGGSFVATTSMVDLQVINATAVASGNDLGLDDISINVCQSQVAVSGPASNCEGNNISANFTVSDVTHTNTWYKWQSSVDGGTTFTDLSTGAQAAYVGDSYTLTYNFGIVNTSMNNTKIRLAVSTSQSGLSDPDCIYFNDYTLIVADCAPVPVKLMSFNGRFANAVASLDWQTSQELNSDHFEIFKSYDGEDFSLLGTVRSAGFSNTVKNYTYQDNLVGSRNYVYYKLKQVDVSGKATFSNIVKLTIGSKSGIEVYPNPFSDQFTASFSAPKAGTATVLIQSNTGQLMSRQVININKGNNSVLINNLPVMPKGIYYVQISNEELNYKTKLQKQ